MARARKKKQKLADLTAQTDPTAELDSALFLSAAQPVLEMLTKVQAVEDRAAFRRELAKRPIGTI